MVSKKLKFGIVFVGIISWALVVYANSAGPPVAHTGAPSETTCTSCHNSFPVNSGSGRVAIAGLPETYTPGQRYNLTVTVSQTGRSRWGFQTTVLTEAGAMAGSFVVTDSARTQLQSAPVNGNNRIYISHTNVGTQRGAQNSATWRFDWTAPATDVGPVTFYLAGNASDGSGSSAGDQIYTTTARVTPGAATPQPPTLTAVAPTGGSTEGGTDVTLTGTNFVQNLTVNFGNTAGTVSAVTATSIRVRTPAGSAGAVDVTVRNPSGAQAVLRNGFTYVAPAANPPTVRLTAPNGGETLSAGGAPFTISWTTTGASAAATFQLDLSTDGGTSFSVPVASGLPATATSFTYAVPATLQTENARLRCRLTDGGTVVTSASERDFKVLPSPVVTGVWPLSLSPGTPLKRIRVFGARFAENSVVVVNGTPATRVKIKSSGLIFLRGLTIPETGSLRIQVRGANGTLSREAAIPIR